MEASFIALQHGGDVLFLLLGAVMVFAMHAGFAFLEVGTVRRKSQVNTFVKILSEWSVSTVVYFLVGYSIASGIHFFISAAGFLGSNQGYELVRFFFLLCSAACIPAIISGGIAERVKFWLQVIAGGIFVGISYSLFESLIWGQNRAGLQGFFESVFGAQFHDFAGSVVVHSIGGWMAMPAIIVLGPRMGRFVCGRSQAILISNIPFLALGSWILAVGWCGFNVMSAQSLQGVSFMAQLGGSLLAVIYALITSYVVYKIIDTISGFRLNEDQEFAGADLTIHHIDAYPEENLK
jgi:Amt family ammonium transporter